MNFANLDLLSVGIAIASTGILGFSIFLSDKKSITNKVFLLFGIATIFWGAFNYLVYNITNTQVALWFLRGSIFFATIQAFLLFSFLNVFPNEGKEMPTWVKGVVLPITAITAALTLTPLVFSYVETTSVEGIIIKVHNGPGLPIFGGVAIGLVVAGMLILIRKVIRVEKLEKKQFIPVLLGLTVTFSLIITFNFIFPAILKNSRFVPLGAVFLFPFILFTAYAIVRHKLLNVKVIGTEILVLVLAIAAIADVVVATNIKTVVIRVLIFALTLTIGFFLIRSVRREVEQKEKLQKLSEDLEKANEELKRTEQLKAEFFSFAAHQVKSPMAVIKGYATLIADGTLAGVPMEKITEIAKKIGVAANRTLAMVNNLLDMRKIEEGRMVYTFEKTDIVAPIRAIVNDLETLAKDKGLQLIIETPKEEVILNVDMQKFMQVIQNLVDNAIKYTDVGWVKVQVEVRNGKVLFTVSDSGRGISKEFASQMFEQFSRDPALAQDTKGTGLGLFIAKQIVEAHGGTIHAESEGEGSGSRFIVEIPLENGSAIVAATGN